MNDGIYFTRGEEHGLTEERLRRAAALRLSLSPEDGRLSVLRTGKGVPFFPQAPGLHCSVSHSGGVWLCALSSAPVGVDLQNHKPCQREKLSRRFFRPEEDAFLAARDYEPFFDLWAVKESYLKYTGQGITAGLDSVSAVCGGAPAEAVNGVPVRMLPFSPDFSLALCGGTAGTPSILEF